MIVTISVLIAFTVYGLKRYEDGLLDVCSTQQDSYVQLVIDQINIKENRTDREIIEEILSTLDASSERYWTFSKSDTVLYIKDALETNRFQALTADSYYTTDSARHFLENLSLNRVYHEKIIINGKEYIASGSMFEYDSETYRVCLLTNVNILLDNNKFLGSKVELIILFEIVYSLLFVLPIIFAMVLNRVSAKLKATEASLLAETSRVEDLNDALSAKEIYDNRQNLFQMSSLELFVSKYMENMDAYPLTFILYQYRKGETVSDFFGANCVLLGKKDIKFYDGKNRFALLLCVQCNEAKAKGIIEKMEGAADLLAVETAAYTGGMQKRYRKICEIMEQAAVEIKEGSAPAKRVIRPDNRTEAKYRQKTETGTDGQTNPTGS